ncbi:MAG TPA: MazG nucleotide pyrophosphohydrolase domain-containing protein [Acidimicrobiales bacterium]|nr:MazG nucleotide pyrophosphohydrolase domain-containing protein [Acidimicrobiales bacterium]
MGGLAEMTARGATPGLLEAVADFVDLVDTLRRECPWDAEQTHTSLRPHLLEEAHEVLEALDNLDEATGEGIEHVCEELGDLLFQVVFHARIAAESGRFDLGDVARGIHDKLHHRHPHVFGGAEQGPEDVPTEQVPAPGERIKREERRRESVLDGIPTTLPALARAAKTVRRAASVDMAPEPPTDGPADEAELGEALLDLVVWARRVGLDPEEALRGAVSRLGDRVRAAEAG